MLGGVLLNDEVEEPVFWNSSPGADGGGGSLEVDGVDGEGEGRAAPGMPDGTVGRRLANRSSRELTTVGVVAEGERRGRGDDSNSVIDGKWLLKDSSWSS